MPAVARIATIVEGHGDRSAFPVVLRRIAADLETAVELPSPIRQPRARLLRPGELERAACLARHDATPDGAVILLLDADDDCPAELGPWLTGRIAEACPDVPVATVLAKREFEAWFLAAADSLRGRRGLPNDLSAPQDPESIRGAKKWLRARMPPGRKYRETADQPALAALIDLCLARTAPSFDRLYRLVAHLVGCTVLSVGTGEDPTGPGSPLPTGN